MTEESKSSAPEAPPAAEKPAKKKAFKRGDVVSFTPHAGQSAVKCTIQAKHENGLFDLQEADAREGEEFQRWYQNVADTEFSAWTE